MQVLSEDCYLDRKNEIPAGKKPWFVLPVFTQHKASGFLPAAWLSLAPDLLPLQQHCWLHASGSTPSCTCHDNMSTACPANLLVLLLWLALWCNSASSNTCMHIPLHLGQYVCWCVCTSRCRAVEPNTGFLISGQPCCSSHSNSSCTATPLVPSKSRPTCMTLLLPVHMCAVEPAAPLPHSLHQLTNTLRDHTYSHSKD